MGVGLGGFQSCPLLSCPQLFRGWMRELVFQKKPLSLSHEQRSCSVEGGCVTKGDCIHTGLCLLKKKKILTLNHFLFLLLILGQNSVFKFSIASQSTQQIKAGKQSCSREVGEGFLTPALDARFPFSESHRCSSPGGAIYELQGDGIVLSSLPVS